MKRRVILALYILTFVLANAYEAGHYYGLWYAAHLLGRAGGIDASFYVEIGIALIASIGLPWVFDYLADAPPVAEEFVSPVEESEAS